MNGAWLQRVIVAVAAAALLAGAGALVSTGQQAEKVAELKRDQAQHEASGGHPEVREKIARIEAKVDANGKVIDKNGDKLDRILDRLP